MDFDSSLASMAAVSAAISHSTGFDLSKHLARLHSASVSHHQSIASWYDEKLHQVLDQFSRVLSFDSMLLGELWAMGSLIG